MTHDHKLPSLDGQTCTQHVCKAKSCRINVQWEKPLHTPIPQTSDYLSLFSQYLTHTSHWIMYHFFITQALIRLCSIIDDTFLL